MERTNAEIHEQDDEETCPKCGELGAYFDEQFSFWECPHCGHTWEN